MPESLGVIIGWAILLAAVGGQYYITCGSPYVRPWSPPELELGVVKSTDEPLGGYH